MDARSDILGAFPPPAGVTPNFDHPDSIGHRVLLVAVICPAIAIPICLLRLYTKRVIIKRLDPEDYSITLGMASAPRTLITRLLPELADLFS